MRLLLWQLRRLRGGLILLVIVGSGVKLLRLVDTIVDEVNLKLSKKATNVAAWTVITPVDVELIESCLYKMARLRLSL